MIARVKRDAVLPLFVTLTYPDKFPSARESKRHLDIFLKRIRRAFPVAGGIWKLEPQQRGAPHYHLLVWGAPLVVVDEINMTVSGLRYFIPSAWYEIAGGGDEKHLLWHEGLLGHGNKQCVQAVRSWRGVWSYASKYLGKTFDVSGWENQWTGRYWGVFNPSAIPFGETKIVMVTRGQAVRMMRMQKRFAYHHKKMHYKKNNSMTIFCDASQWVEKLEVMSGEV